MSLLEDAEAVLRSTLHAAAGAVGDAPVALERLPRDPVPERPGAVTSGWATHVEVRDPDAALEAVAQRWRAAGWEVTRTPVAVLARLEGLTVSLVLDTAATTARLSGGTPPLPEVDRRSL